MPHLNSRENDSSIGMGQPRGDPLTDGLSLTIILRGVVRQRVQDKHLQIIPVRQQGFGSVQVFVLSWIRIQNQPLFQCGSVLRKNLQQLLNESRNSRIPEISVRF
jgi:hypothetical protein